MHRTELLGRAHMVSVAIGLLALKERVMEAQKAALLSAFLDKEMARFPPVHRERVGELMFLLSATACLSGFTDVEIADAYRVSLTFQAFFDGLFKGESINHGKVQDR